MTKVYYEYTDDFYLDLDVELLIRQSVKSFEKYLLKVKDFLNEDYQTFIMHLENHLRQDKDNNIIRQYETCCRALLKIKNQKIHADSFHKVRFLPQYFRLKALVDITGKEKAIEFTKGYIDEFYLGIPAREGVPTSIKELKDLQIKGNIKGQDMHWISHDLDEHSYMNLVFKCRVHEVLKGYDAELMEVITCYPDFSMFKSLNPNFILTRTQTLVGGASYCDTCYHDKRHGNSFDHPPINTFNECLMYK
ncbi:MAG: L-2-amino-thiazoline-4-carboxylic acid hydrolase [Clostridiales bacterium]|nr:L-2-amino-thiazoline-4-carboxylic acid hydrolase [Clostridiales bacterium]